MQITVSLRSLTAMLQQATLTQHTLVTGLKDLEQKLLRKEFDITCVRNTERNLADLIITLHYLDMAAVGVDRILSRNAKGSVHANSVPLSEKPGVLDG